MFFNKYDLCISIFFKWPARVNLVLSETKKECADNW